jgi:hypothetical protein
MNRARQRKIARGIATREQAPHPKYLSRVLRGVKNRETQLQLERRAYRVSAGAPR